MKWHSMEVDGRMHNEEAKVVDLVGEHAPTNKRKKSK
jgi:hypothetical protein